MDSNRRPVSVLILGWLYIAVGCVGFAAHFHDFAKPEGVWIALTEMLAIIAGVFMLRGKNWARWLAIAWMAFHVALSAWPVSIQLAVHGLLFVAITWLLLRPDAGRFFRGATAGELIQ